MHDRWHDMAQTVRHLAILTDFVPLKWHDLARHIAGKNRASVSVALFDRNILHRDKNRLHNQLKG